MKDQDRKILESLTKGAIEAKKAYLAAVPTPVGFYSADLAGNALSAVDICDEGECGGAYLSGIKYRSDLYNFFKNNGECDGKGVNFNSHIEIKNSEIECSFTFSKNMYKGYTLSMYDKTLNSQSAERSEAKCKVLKEHLMEHANGIWVKTYLT